jgi:quercetin dioxygenase-like cupin family protein
MANGRETAPSIPPDNLQRNVHIAKVDGAEAPHVSVVGDTYTILVSGRATEGRYSAIDMIVPPGGGPPPHRHDFEEMFTVLEGEIEFAFRNEKIVAPSGTTINIPANAPHSFRNASSEAARMLCICSPAGAEEFFLEVGVGVESRTSPAPRLSPEEQKAFVQKATALAPRYRTELLKPD